jgi:hypothetical protein
MAALAEFPDRVQKVLKNANYPSDSFVEANLYQAGQLFKIVVDA